MCAVAPKEAQILAAAMPGVSHEQVAALLIGLGDKAFENRDQLVAFVGLDVRLRQSGKWQGKQVLSRRGNGYLRKVLFQIGWGLMMHHEGVPAQILTPCVRAGKNTKTRISVALARKFLRDFLFAFYWKKTVSLQATPAAVPMVSVAGAILTVPSFCSV